MVEQSSGSDEEGGESEVSEDDGPKDLPESLQRVFSFPGAIEDYTLTQHEREMRNSSIFNKVTTKADTHTTSETLEETRIKKANDLYETKSLFKGAIKATDRHIAPLVSVKLDRKQRRLEKEETTGKNWGQMKRVELTDEVKADLRAIRMRNQLFKDRFYKTNDSKKLPEFFQIGTVVDDGRGLDNRTDRWTKKQRKGTIAQQFLMDDQASGFSKKKYEQLNEKKRRMGDKKRQLKINLKNKHKGK